MCGERKVCSILSQGTLAGDDELDDSTSAYREPDGDACDSETEICMEISVERNATADSHGSDGRSECGD